MPSPEALNQLGKGDGQTSIKSYFKAVGNRKKVGDVIVHTSEAKAKANAEADTEEKTRLEAEAKSKAEEKVKLEREEQARLEEEVELKTKAEVKEKARLEAEEQTRIDDEAYVKSEAEEKARLESKAKAKAKAKANAKEKTRLEAEEKAKLEAQAEAKDKTEARKRVAYDHVFEIDIDKDIILKLPYKFGQDPHQVAQDFIYKHELPYEYLYHIEDFIREKSMAPFEIDIDLCLKDKRPFKIANASKVKRVCVMASCLDELQWLSRSKLNMNPGAKVSTFLEKDGTEVDDQKFFEKLSEQTRFVAKEVPFNNDDSKKILKNLTSNGFKHVRIGRFSDKKKIGLKISGVY